MTRNVMIVAVAGLAIAPAAAQNRNWVDAVNGNWTDTFHWDPADVPDVAGETATIGFATAFDITLANLDPTLDGLFITNPLATLSLNPSVDMTLAALANDGLVRVNPTNSSVDATITASSSFTITGAGVLELVGGIGDARIEASNGAVLTNGANHTIRGAGQINAPMINEGTLRSTSTGFGNVLEIQTTDKINNGTIEAGANSFVEIDSVNIDQSGGGVLDALDDEIRFRGAVDITGGTLTATTGNVSRETGTSIFDNVIIDCDLFLDPNTTVVSVGDMFVNQGTVFVNNTNSSANAIIRFDADALVTGGGTILLGGGPSDAFLLGAPDVTITNDVGHTIEGSGDIDVAFVNNGVVRVLQTTFGNVLNLRDTDKTNNATIEATANSVINIRDITIDQSSVAQGGRATGAGVLDTKDGTIDFESNTTSSIIGGTITGLPEGNLRRQGGGTTSFTNLTLETDLTVDPNSNIELFGSTFINNSLVSINLSNSSANSSLTAKDPILITGNGEILIGGGPNDSFFLSDPGVPVTLDADQTLRGSGNIDALLTNRGTVRSENTLFGNSIELNGQAINNEALFTTQGTGIFRFGSITINQTPDGVIDTVDTVSEFETGRSPRIQGGSLNASGTGSYRAEVTTTTLADLTLNAPVTIQPSATLLIEGTVESNDVITNNLTNSSANTFVNFTPDASLTGNGEIILGGGVFDSFVSTAPDSTATIGPGQTVTGSGTFVGDFTFEGTFAPDGGFTISDFGAIAMGNDGSLTLTDTTDLVFDVRGTQSDRITPGANTTVHLDGDLIVALDQTAVYTLGQEIPVVEAGATITGAFDTNNVANQFINADLGLRLVQRPDEVVLRVVNLACPADVVQPLNVLDLSDIDVFIQFFISQDPVADIAAPLGVLDLGDIDLYIQLFLNNCF
ncbi:MAG: GC-type dockerin domain-anchored protein [Planctomycetota bacterium]